ncbi:MAG TPA: hypothetical protein VGM94_02760 [Galbitalea sp.]
MATWHTLESIRTRDSALGSLSNELVQELLDVAQEDITLAGLAVDDNGVAQRPFKSPYTLGDPIADPAVPVNIPTRFRMAQYMRVMEIWDGQETNAGGTDLTEIGGPGYIVRIPTMGIKIRRMIWPDLSVVRIG